MRYTQIESIQRRSRLALTAAACLTAFAAGAALVHAEDRPSADSAAGADEQKSDDEEAGEDEEKLQTLRLADGRLVLQAPARWERQRPAVSIIEVELTIPAEEEDGEPGRLTIMQAGGSVEANIERWFDQFVQPDGKPSREAAKVEEKEEDDLKVHVVDLSGTFLDQRGPFAPAQKKEGFRMLAAIIQTEGAGNYFVKFTGPADLMEENAKPFSRMIDRLQWK